jgi:hypothetical protein
VKLITRVMELFVSLKLMPEARLPLPLPLPQQQQQPVGEPLEGAVEWAADTADAWAVPGDLQQQQQPMPLELLVPELHRAQRFWAAELESVPCYAQEDAKMRQQRLFLGQHVLQQLQAIEEHMPQHAELPQLIKDVKKAQHSMLGVPGQPPAGQAVQQAQRERLTLLAELFRCLPRLLECLQQRCGAV